MNQTFSLPRFGRLLYTYLSDSRGQLLTSLALLVGILIAFSLIAYTGIPFVVDRSRSTLFFLAGCLTWYLFTWQQVEVLNHRERSINYLLQPASQAEKFLLIWLVSGMGFLMVFLLMGSLVDAFGVAYINGKSWSPQQLQEISNMGGLLTIKPLYQSRHLMPPQLLVIIGLLHPFSLAAFLFVKRYSLAVVGVLMLITFMLGLFLNSSIINWLLGLPKPVQTIPFMPFGVELPGVNKFRQLELPQPLGNIIRYATYVVVIVLLYVIAFFRLKEREV